MIIIKIYTEIMEIASILLLFILHPPKNTYGHDRIENFFAGIWKFPLITVLRGGMSFPHVLSGKDRIEDSFAGIWKFPLKKC